MIALEHVGAPSSADLDAADMFRCEACHQIEEEPGETLAGGAQVCHACASRPVQCRGCLRSFPAIALHASEMCDACVPDGDL